MKETKKKVKFGIAKSKPKIAPSLLEQVPFSPPVIWLESMNNVFELRLNWVENWKKQIYCRKKMVELRLLYRPRKLKVKILLRGIYSILIGGIHTYIFFK